LSCSSADCSAISTFSRSALFHINEVHHDDAPRSRKRICRTISFTASRLVLTMVSSNRVEPLPRISRVDVDGHQRFRVVDDDVAAGLQPHLGAQRFVQFVLDAELLEDRLLLGVELDLGDEFWLEAADEFHHLAVFLFVVNPNAREIVADVVAQDTLDQVQVAVQQRGRFAIVVLVLDLIPGLARNSMSVRISSSVASPAAVRTMKPPG